MELNLGIFRSRSQAPSGLKLEASTSSTSSTASGKGEVDKSQVRLVIATEYACDAGEKIVICGDGDMLGSWDPAKGVPLRSDASKGDDSWQASVILTKGSSYEFKLATIREDSGAVRWQSDLNRVVRIPAKVSSSHAYLAFVPWEGITSVSKVADTLAMDALDSLDNLKKKVEETGGDAKAILEGGEKIFDGVEGEEEAQAEATSRAVDSAVSDLDQIIDEAESSDQDPTSLESLDRDIQVAAASRRVVIQMQLMQEAELRAQLPMPERDDDDDDGV